MVTSRRKTWLKWAVWAAVVLALLAGAVKAMQARKAKQALADEAAAALKVATVFELSAQDVVTVQNRSLVQVIDMSGTVRAVNTAAIKAKVAGEVQGLQVREGDRVAAGQVLGHVDTTEFQARVQQADEQSKAAAAQVAIAQRALGNNQALVNQGFISATALDTSASNLAAAQATHRAAVAALDIARKSLADTALRSPIAGQVSTRLVQNGERVGVDAKVLEVVDLSAMELEVAVTPADAAQLATGQTGQMEVEGLSAPVAATVVRISPAAQAPSRSVMVYLKLQPQPGLRHGLFAKGNVQTGVISGLSVPASSIRNDRPQPYVQWVKPAADIPTDGSPPASQIAHQPVKVIGQGSLTSPKAHLPSDTLSLNP
jgi:membrane fusion protein (multidrug efflux system)